MNINKVHNFLFHPLSNHHNRQIKAISIVTIVALSILTAGLFAIAFAVVNLKNRKFGQPKVEKKIPHTFPSNQKKRKLDDIEKPAIEAPKREYVKAIRRQPKILNQTARLLNDENGFSYSDNEPHFDPRCGYIGPIQGHDRFRAKVAEITKNDFHVLSPKAIRENRKINPDLSLILTAKRIAHALSLSGELILENNNTINLEGFHEVFTLPMLADSFEKFALANSHIVNDDMRQWVLEYFTQTARCDSISEQDIAEYQNLLKNPQFEGPLCATSGHNWHLINLIFYRHFVFSINRGSDPFKLKFDDEPLDTLYGTTIFTADKAFDLSTTIAKKIFKRMAVNHQQAAKLNHLQNELDLKFLDIKRSKKQSVGNCTYVNTKLMVLVLLALYSLRNYEKIIIPDLDQAFDAAEKIYKEWVKFDRNYVVNDLLEEIKTLEKEHKTDSFVYRTLIQLLEFVSQKSHKLGETLRHQVSLINSP